jgi:hypothetical protein
VPEALGELLQGRADVLVVVNDQDFSHELKLPVSDLAATATI